MSPRVDGIEVASEVGVTLDIPNPDRPVGGRLKDFWREWQKLGAPKRVVRWLRDGYKLEFFKDRRGFPLTPPLSIDPHPELIQNYQDPVKRQKLDEMLNELVSKRAITTVPPGKRVFWNRVFLVPKKNGKMRLVTNLRPLNQWLANDSFQMDHAAVVRRALAPNMFATSIDLSDAYLHIPLHPDAFQYLAFQVGTRRYYFVVLPFGLNSAPRVFDAVMRVLKKWGRRVGLMIFQYLDDWLQLHFSKEVLARQTALLIRQCLSLGLLVNLSKSEPVPTRRIVFLGDFLDFQQGYVYPSQERIQAILDKVEAVTRRSDAPLYRLHSLLGLLTATEKVVPNGRLHYRSFQKLVNGHLRRGVDRFERVRLNALALQDLLWWIDVEHLRRGQQMAPPVPRHQLQTDASPHGWGAHFGGEVFGDRWPAAQKGEHINCLEMRAVILSCTRLADRLRNQSVMCLIDNRTTVAYIQKQGGTRSVPLMMLTRQLWEVLERFNITLHARHLQGSLNVVADLASRQGRVVNTEWSVSKQVFSWICRQSPWGMPEIDLFANSLNHKLPLYFSPCPDPKAMAVDALTTQWPQRHTIYAFPPTAIMEKVIEKLQLERPQRLLLVAPMLLEAPWFPQLMQTPHASPVLIPFQVGDLVQPHWSYAHPNPALFNLHLWRVGYDP